MEDVEKALKLWQLAPQVKILLLHMLLLLLMLHLLFITPGGLVSLVLCDVTSLNKP